MSVSSPGINAGHYYSNVVSPLTVNLAFTVNSADTGGLGVTSVKSNGFVRNVFMHTSQTPGVNNGVTNPNPLAGFVMVQFNRNFNVYLAELMSVIGTTTGSIKIDNSALTAGQVYVITTLGNATLAKWQAIGVPAGVTPAVGVTFIALTNGGTGNTLTSRVSTPVPSGVTGLELIGVPSTMIANSSIAQNGGAYLFGQFLSPTVPVTSGTAGNAVTLNAGTTLEATGGGTVATTEALTAPADGSIVSMKFWFDASSVSVDGL